MVRVIKVTSSTAEAERRLVSTMINIERGALTVSDDGEALPLPHTPYPTIEVKPTTKRGLPVSYHLKPTVGVVYYTAGSGFQIQSFIDRVSKGLGQYGYGHLTSYRAITVSPCAIVKNTLELDECTAVVGPRRPYRKGKGGIKPSARLILFTDPSCEDVPSHISYRAAFTWVFTSIVPLLSIRGGPRSAAELNAIMSSVVYDDAGLVKLDNGKIVYEFTKDDLTIPKLPEELLKVGEVGLSTVAVIVTRAGGKLSLELSGCIPSSDAGITRVAKTVPWDTSFESLDPLTDSASASPSASSALPTAADPLTTNASDEHKETILSCHMCSTPLWGEVYILDNPKMPTGRELDGAWPAFAPFGGIKGGEPMLQGNSSCICKYCARKLCASVATHLDCKVLRSHLKITHNEAFGSATPWKFLVPLITYCAGRVTAVPDMPGHFLLGPAGSEIVLRPHGPASLACTAVPHLSSRPILSVPNLIEMR